VVISLTNGAGQYIDIPLNVGDNAWQYVSQQFITEYAYNLITIYLMSSYNVNTTYFDNISLYKDESGNSYTYDSNGNIVTSKDNAQQTSSFNYNGNNNLIKGTNPNGGTLDYTYDTTYRNRLLKVTSSTGVSSNYTYNSYGSATSAKVMGANNTTYVQTDAAYSADGRYQTYSYDTRGNQTTFAYNTGTGTVASVTEPKGGKVNYIYDSIDNLVSTSQTDGNKTYSNGYTYEDDRLKTITHNGTTYTFNYDTFGNISNVKVGSQTLIAYYYTPNNGYLNNPYYWNNQNIFYTYDKFDRLATHKRAQGTYQFGYDARGNLAYTKSPDGTTENYIYDIADRLLSFSDTTGFKGSYTYDANSNINSVIYNLNSTINKINYNYDKDNRITNVTFDSNTQTTTYDTLSRMSTVKTTTAGGSSRTTTYGYINTNTANRTTFLLGSITNGSNPTINYTYDSNGNIETISNGGTLQQKYYYDGLNQLIREDNVALNKTIVYNYDIGGNLTSKVEYPYTTGTPGTATKTYAYLYGNSTWKDQLTSYDGKAITYDVIGNPLTYNGNTYTWQNGRELAKITNGTNTYQYTYNDSGIRTSKTINGVKTQYYLERHKSNI